MGTGRTAKGADDALPLDDLKFGHIEASANLRRCAAHAMYSAARVDEATADAVRSTLSAGYSPEAVEKARVAWQEAIHKLDEAARNAELASKAAAALHRRLTAP